VRTIGWCWLSVVLIVSLSDLPLAAAGTSEKPLGVVVVAEHAHFAGAKAAAGTTIYAGDAFDTEESGTLCLRLGIGQIFLLAESAASVSRESEIVRIALTKGTAVFSSPAPAQFELETPAGTLRGAAGRAVSGRVALTGPRELVIAASNGDLTLDNDSELHLIPAGKAVRVVIDDSDATAFTDQDNPSPTPHARRRRKRLAFYIIFAGSVGGISAAIFHELSESPYKP
jgi:hypothetical protein